MYDVNSLLKFVCVDCVLEGAVIYFLLTNGYLQSAESIALAVAILGMVTKPIVHQITMAL